MHRKRGTVTAPVTGTTRGAWPAARRGFVNSAANPKLAAFFISLFPQFVRPGDPLLPAALAMSTLIVSLDVVWYGSVAYFVDRFRQVIAPRILDRVERVSGAVLIGLGARLAIERP
jgi:threonine/homoserine/homoserine lactone efflux protein